MKTEFRNCICNTLLIILVFLLLLHFVPGRARAKEHMHSTNDGVKGGSCEGPTASPSASASPLKHDAKLVSDIQQSVPPSTSVRNGTPALLIISWNQCGHCTSLAATLNRITTTESRPVRFALVNQINQTENPDIVRLGELGLHNHSFPRIIGWARDATQATLYNGDRSEESIQKFVDTLSLS